MSEFNIGTDINLLKLLATRLLIQGTSGSGKSYALRYMEETFSGHVQQIIFDPEGEFVTLREKFPFALVAVDGGDIPLNIHHVQILAQMILKTRLSVIIDLYDLTEEDRVQFVGDFMKHVMLQPKKDWHEVLVYIDEAQLFCPEGTVTYSSHFIRDYVTRGRKRGYGIVMATQRLALLDKSVAALLSNKMIGLTTMDIDIARAAFDLGITKKQAQTMGISALEQGDFFGFGPAFSVRNLFKFHIPAVQTTHLDPSLGFNTIIYRETIPVPEAIRGILSQMKDLPAQAERQLETEKDMLEEITRLREQLVKEKSHRPITDTTELTRLAKERDELAQKLSDQKGAFQSLDRTYKYLMARLRELFDFATGPHLNGLPIIPEGENNKGIIWSNLAAEPVIHPKKHVVTMTEHSGPIEIPQPEITPVIIEDITDYGPHGEGMPTPKPYNKCEKAILEWLARFNKESFNLWQLAFGTGYSQNSGSFGQALVRLQKDALIKKEDSQYSIDKAAKTAIFAILGIHGWDDGCLMLSSYDHVLDNASSRILEFLCAHPNTIYDRKQLADHLGYSETSGSFGQALGYLHRLDLMDKSKYGYALANRFTPRPAARNK